MILFDHIEVLIKFLKSIFIFKFCFTLFLPIYEVNLLNNWKDRINLAISCTCSFIWIGWNEHIELELIFYGSHQLCRPVLCFYFIFRPLLLLIIILNLQVFSFVNLKTIFCLIFPFSVLMSNLMNFLVP